MIKDWTKNQRKSTEISAFLPASNLSVHRSAGPGQFDPFALTGGWLFRGCESISLASRIRSSKIISTFGGRWFVRNTPVADDSWWLFHVPARHILDTIWLSICLFCLMDVETPPTSTKDDIMIYRYTDILVWYTMSTGTLPMILGILLVDGADWRCCGTRSDEKGVVFLAGNLNQIFKVGAQNV